MWSGICVIRRAGNPANVLPSPQGHTTRLFLTSLVVDQGCVDLGVTADRPDVRLTSVSEFSRASMAEGREAELFGQLGLITYHAVDLAHPPVLIWKAVPLFGHN